MPNKAEIKLDNLLQEIQPNEWKFNGYPSEKIAIGSKIPDFLNINGKRAVIELFGEHVHSPEHTFLKKIPYSKTYDGTIEHYKQFGFDCLIIWCNELQNMENVRIKIIHWVNDKISNGGFTKLEGYTEFLVKMSKCCPECGKPINGLNEKHVDYSMGIHMQFIHPREWEKGGGKNDQITDSKSDNGK